MKKLTIAVAALLSPVIHAQTHVDLSQSFNADVFLESGGTGLGAALDDQGRRIDAATLPTTFVDGATVTSTNGDSAVRARILKMPRRGFSRVGNPETTNATRNRRSNRRTGHLLALENSIL